MENWVAEGRVTVNGETAQVGDRVTERDVIKVSGRRVYLRDPETKRTRVLLYHKQEGEIVSRDDPKGRATVFEQLPKIRGAKWVSVGRLDFNTEGLMIFTTSGELANRLMHPRFEVEREYAVRVLGELTPEMQQQLIDGVELEDGVAQVESLAEAGGEGANRWWRVVIKEGRYREVRRLFDAVGVKVSRLIRTRYGPVALPPQLKRGQKHELDETEVKRLLRWADMPVLDSRPGRQGAVRRASPCRAAPVPEPLAVSLLAFLVQVHQAAGHFLILFPRNPLWAPKDLAAISQALHAIGLTGEPREPLLFSAGPEYLGLVTYLGCSPQISLGENEGATTIRLSGIYPLPHFLAGKNLKRPRCPQCQKTLAGQSFSGDFGEPLCCDHCGYTGQAHAFDWRRSAAFGRVFVQISNVFESEAVPGEALSDCLLKATGEEWEYCYIRRGG